MLDILVARSDAAGHVNEDAIGHHAGAAWVIDGATGVGGALLDAPSDAAWFAAQANRALVDRLSTDPHQPIAELIRGVIGDCAAALARERIRHDGEPHETPSAALAIVRTLDGGRVELATLGDCRIAWRDRDGMVRLFGPTGLNGVERRTLALVAQHLAEDETLTPAALFDRLLPHLRANRRLMNSAQGYWILGTDPAAAEHLDVAIIDAAPGDRVALASDGFLRLEEMFGTMAPADLLAIDTPAAFDHHLAALRPLGVEPGSCRRFPRVKVHDDVSFLLCAIAEG